MVVVAGTEEEDGGRESAGTVLVAVRCVQQANGCVPTEHAFVVERTEERRNGEETNDHDDTTRTKMVVVPVTHANEDRVLRV